MLQSLTVQDVYGLYPCSERPEYVVGPGITDYAMGALARPEEFRCACGCSLRFSCAVSYVGIDYACDSDTGRLAVWLEREQHGDTRYGFRPDAIPAYKHGWYSCKQNPNYQRSMHLADRLLRAFPGILMSESANAMAVYRLLSPNDIAVCRLNPENRD